MVVAMRSTELISGWTDETTKHEKGRGQLLNIVLYSIHTYLYHIIIAIISI